MRCRSPLEHTSFLGYSNGCIGYLPTPKAFGEGGMEVNESCRNYLLPSTLTRNAGKPEMSEKIFEGRSTP